MVLHTVTFRDTVCLLSADFCSTGFDFYAISSQSGLKDDEEGIVGLAPIPRDGDDHDSFIKALRADGIIDHAVFAIYVSKTPEVYPHMLHVGDWDPNLVADGEEIEFYNLSLDGSKWSIELTSMKLGDDVLEEDSLEWGLVDSNVPGIGLREEHFNRTAAMLKDYD